MRLETRQGSVDGISAYLKRPDVRKKLRGRQLLSGNIWPKDEKERAEWEVSSYGYLVATSKVIGTGVRGMEKLPVQVIPPQRIISSELHYREGKGVIIGETKQGVIELEIPPIEGLKGGATREEFLRTMDEMQVEPLGDRVHIYNACTTTIYGGKAKLVLAEDDLVLIEKLFWTKLIFIGIETIGDIRRKACEEMIQSPNGSLLRLRRVAEKLAKPLDLDPSEVTEGIIGSAISHGGMEKILGWFLERIKDKEDQRFVRMVAYLLLAKHGIDPANLFEIMARRTAENPKFWHEYRKGEDFDSRGITKLMFEMMVLGEHYEKGELEGRPSTFQIAQYYARAFQFMKEMQEVIQKREFFLGVLKTGSFRP